MPPARRRRIIGPEERSVREDLKTFPPEVRKGSIAASMISLAQEVDVGGMTVRDKTQAIREIRLCYMTLRELAPAGIGDDELDRQRKKREERMKREGRTAE